MRSHISVGKTEWENSFGDIGVNGRTILKWILKKWISRKWLDSSGSETCGDLFLTR